MISNFSFNTLTEERVYDVSNNFNGETFWRNKEKKNVKKSIVDFSISLTQPQINKASTTDESITAKKEITDKGLQIALPRNITLQTSQYFLFTVNRQSVKIKKISPNFHSYRMWTSTLDVG